MNDSSRALGRRWRLQFSLRLLLAAFTSFAIGFPIWYRWPYQEAESLAAGDRAVRITAWQRQWGGGRLKHGPERLIVNGQTAELTTYLRGRKEGPYWNGRLTGQFANDMREGVWTDDSQWFRRVETWHRDLLEGPAKIELPDG